MTPTKLLIGQIFIVFAIVIAEPSIWEGGVRTLKAGSPEAWRAISDAAEMRHQNTNMIENARIGAKKSQKAV